MGISSLYGSCTRSRRSLSGVLSMGWVQNPGSLVRRGIASFLILTSRMGIEAPSGRGLHQGGPVLLPGHNIPGIASFPVKALIRGTFLSGASPVWVSTFREFRAVRELLPILYGTPIRTRTLVGDVSRRGEFDVVREIFLPRIASQWGFFPSGSASRTGPPEGLFGPLFRFVRGLLPFRKETPE